MSLKICLTRIDDRLIHGQVATSWTKITKANRILVVNDGVAKDEFRKSLLKQAAPPGVTANVITVDKLIQIYTDSKYDSFVALLIFSNPEDVLKVIEGGVPITSVNIGGMSYSEGKKKLTKAIAVTNEDVEVFKKLNDKGIELEVRMVASDSKVQIMNLLKDQKLL